LAQHTDIDFSDLEVALFHQPWFRPCCIVDGAHRPSIALELEDRGASFQCLFNGELEPEVAAVAPYLVDLEGQAALAEWLFSIGCGHNLGIYLLTGMEFLEVRKHFRRITMVRMPDDTVTYFRFYDPRVLRSFLPTCDENQLRFIYGDVVEQFVFEDGDGAVASLRLDEITARVM
jgi:hypothetical protein